MTYKIHFSDKMPAQFQQVAATIDQEMWNAIILAKYVVYNGEDYMLNRAYVDVDAEISVVVLDNLLRNR